MRGNEYFGAWQRQQEGKAQDPSEQGEVMEQLVDMSDEHLQAVRKSIAAEYPGCGVAIVVISGSSHWLASNVPRPVLAGQLEHIVMHLRHTCRQCGGEV